MFNPVDTKVSFPKMEEKILKYWEENNIFQKSIDNREDCQEYVFYDGLLLQRDFLILGILYLEQLRILFPDIRL